MQDPVYVKTKSRSRRLQSGFFFTQICAQKALFSLVTGRASLGGKRLRKGLFYCQSRSPQNSYSQLCSLISGLQVKINIQANIYWLNAKIFFFYEDMYILSDFFSCFF